MVVPAYNEALKLHASLTEILDYLRGLCDRYRFEVIVVDDGSTDGTGAIADEFAAANAGVRVLHHAVNFRLGQALRYAFGQSHGDYVVVFDSDLSYSVDHIGRMLEAIESEHARIVVASPYMKGGRTSAIPWRREAMSKGVNRLLAATSHGDIHTVTGMVRCYDGPFIRSLDLKSMGPEINTEILYKAQIMRARVVEIPAHLDWTDQEERMRSRKVSIRVSTTSKLLMFSSFLFRPIVFFLVPGLLVLIVALWTLGRSGLDGGPAVPRPRQRQPRLPDHPGLPDRLRAAPPLLRGRRLRAGHRRAADQPRVARDADQALLRGDVPPGHRRPPPGGATRAPRRPHRDAAAGRPGAASSTSCRSTA